MSLVLLALPLHSYAQSSSANYKLEEAYFGTGGELDASSTNYRSQQSVGSLGVGNTSSANYDAIAGGVTPFVPFLEMAVTGNDINFGILSPTTPAYQSSQGGACNCSFYVKSYLSSGYVVVSASLPPTNESGISLAPKSTLGASSSDPSVEEFGINLVANTAPGTFGANPVNDPDDTFADGQAYPGYGTANQYKYAASDIIASSASTAGNQGVGKTNYTISYLLKIKNTTPAGLYVLNHNLVAIATY